MTRTQDKFNFALKDAAVARAAMQPRRQVSNSGCQNTVDSLILADSERNQRRRFEVHSRKTKPDIGSYTATGAGQRHKGQAKRECRLELCG